MENGSHNLIPFLQTQMVLPQVYLSRGINQNWYTYVNDSLVNTSEIPTETVRQFQEIFEQVKKNIGGNPFLEH